MNWVAFVLPRFGCELCEGFFDHRLDPAERRVVLGVLLQR
jgi:hypothetical protein